MAAVQGAQRQPGVWFSRQIPAATGPMKSPTPLSTHPDSPSSFAGFHPPPRWASHSIVAHDEEARA